MALPNLLRTPLGIVVTTYVVLVLGFGIAAFLLNVPIFFVLGAAILAAGIGFLLVTWKEPSDAPATDATPPAQT